jgi:hypothetical protein
MSRNEDLYRCTYTKTIKSGSDAIKPKTSKNSVEKTITYKAIVTKTVKERKAK